VILLAIIASYTPTTSRTEGCHKGIGANSFEKGIAKHPGKSRCWQVQYRMHEDIMEFLPTISTKMN